MKQSIIIEIELDENNLPDKINMKAGRDSENNSLDSFLFSAWDAKKKETLCVDLWTKNMLVNDMFIFYHQALMSMATSLQKSTSENELADGLRDYCSFFAKKTNIINSNS